MKHCFVVLGLLLLASCSDVPKCNYVGVSSEGANAGCMVVHNKKILIVEDNSGLLSLPGGSMNPGEIAQCTAEREVWEETGIVVKANNKIETQHHNGTEYYGRSRCMADPFCT